MHIIVYIYIYINNKTTPNEIFSPSNKIHRKVGRASDLSAPLYNELLIGKWLSSCHLSVKLRNISGK